MTESVHPDRPARCPSRWYDEDADNSCPCQRDEGHLGNHEYLIEWDNDGNLITD